MYNICFFFVKIVFVDSLSFPLYTVIFVVDKHFWKILQPWYSSMF